MSHGRNIKLDPAFHLRGDLYENTVRERREGISVFSVILCTTVGLSYLVGPSSQHRNFVCLKADLLPMLLHFLSYMNKSDVNRSNLLLEQIFNCSEMGSGELRGKTSYFRDSVHMQRFHDL